MQNLSQEAIEQLQADVAAFKDEMRSAAADVNTVHRTRQGDVLMPFSLGALSALIIMVTVILALKL